MDKERALREHLVSLLNGDQTRITFEDGMKDFEFETAGKQVDDMPYTAWEVLEHMRIVQWDVLHFSMNPEHISPAAEEYWPDKPGPDSEEEFHQSISQFKSDLEAMKEFISNPETDLYTPLPHGSGQTVLREALVMGEHNAYHIGQLMLIKKYYQE